MTENRLKTWVKQTGKKLDKHLKNAHQKVVAGKCI